MSEKIYKVIRMDTYWEDGTGTNVRVAVFTEKELALTYLKQQIREIKNEVDDNEDYCVEEDDKSYERYLEGEASQDSISIWMEEDILDNEKLIENEDKEYEL